MTTVSNLNSKGSNLPGKAVNFRQGRSRVESAFQKCGLAAEGAPYRSGMSH